MLPSPLVGEGGSRRLTDEGFCNGGETPHPTSLRSATFSHKGRREAGYGLNVTLCAITGRGRSSEGSARVPTWMKPAMVSPSSTPNRATAAGS